MNNFDTAGRAVPDAARVPDHRRARTFAGFCGVGPRDKRALRIFAVRGNEDQNGRALRQVRDGTS